MGVVSQALLLAAVTALVSTTAATSEPTAISPSYAALSPPDDALHALAGAPGYLGVVVARKEVNVAPEMGGLLASIHVELGERVRRGQLLFRLEDTQLQHEVAIAGAAVKSAEATAVRARIARDESQRRYQRRKDAGDAYSTEDLERAGSEAEAAQAELQSAQADLAEKKAQLALLEANLQRARVRARFDCVVAGRYKGVGAMVSSTTPVVRLISTAAPLVRFAVPPAEAAQFVTGTPVHITFAGRLQPVRARIIGVSPEVDPAIEMILVEANLAADDFAAASIRVGMVGKVTR